MLQSTENICCCGTVTTPIRFVLCRAVQGLSFVAYCVVEIMGANGCFIVFSKIGL